MGIILEGADASGKSTLARLIEKSTGRQLYLAGGKPKDDPQMWEMIEAQRQHSAAGHIIDRVSSISQQVYREGLYMRDDLQSQIAELVTPKSGEPGIVVYCRPPDNVLMNPTYHEWKDYDTEEWKQTILNNQADYVKRYDHLMSMTPCIVYDWTSPDSVHIRDMLCSLAGDQTTVSFKLLRQMQMKGGVV